MKRQKTPWHRADYYRALRSQQWSSWLFDRGSMTKHFRQLDKEAFCIRMLNQTWGMASFAEAQFLGGSLRSRVFIREIYLCQANKPWVYAKTLIPYETLQKHYVDLYPALKGQPLGDVLFSRSYISRGKLDVALLRPGHREYDGEKFETQEALWARRSLFWLRENPLSILEVFLPAFYHEN